MKEKNLKIRGISSKNIVVRNLLVLMFLVGVCNKSMAQMGTAKEFEWDGVVRDYIEYVPQSYNPSQPTAVVFMLHGLRDSMEYKLELSGMVPFADRYGWIMIVPEALVASVNIFGQDYEIGTMWNAGMSVSVAGLTLAPNQDVDDAGFLLNLLDQVKEQYNIHPDSVFFSGVSMGGFMCQRMAIEHSDKINAVASVSGTIATSISTQTPVSNIDILHIHGTKDSVVTYDGADFSFPPFGTFNIGLSAEATVEYWRSYNGCNPTASECRYIDSKDDGMTFERYDYTGSTDGSRVSFIKVINGEHDWYAGTETYDICYADEIQKFFRGEQPNNVGIDAVADVAVECAIYPNPATSVVNISAAMPISRVEIYSMSGAVVMEAEHLGVACRINVENYKPGMYLAKIYTDSNVVVKKLIVK